MPLNSGDFDDDAMLKAMREAEPALAAKLESAEAKVRTAVSQQEALKTANDELTKQAQATQRDLDDLTTRLKATQDEFDAIVRRIKTLHTATQ